MKGWRRYDKLTDKQYKKMQKHGKCKCCKYSSKESVYGKEVEYCNWHCKRIDWVGVKKYCEKFIYEGPIGDGRSREIK